MRLNEVTRISCATGLPDPNVARRSRSHIERCDGCMYGSSVPPFATTNNRTQVVAAIENLSEPARLLRNTEFVPRTFCREQGTRTVSCRRQENSIRWVGRRKQDHSTSFDCCDALPSACAHGTAAFLAGGSRPGLNTFPRRPSAPDNGCRGRPLTLHAAEGPPRR